MAAALAVTASRAVLVSRHGRLPITSVKAMPCARMAQQRNRPGAGHATWWRDSERLLYRDTAIWLCVFGAAWGVLRAARARPASQPRGILRSGRRGVRRRVDAGALDRVDTRRRQQLNTTPASSEV